MSEEQTGYGNTPANQTLVAASPTIQIVINLSDLGRPFGEPQHIQIARLVKAITEPDAAIRSYDEEVDAGSKRRAELMKSTGADRIARAFEEAASPKVGENSD